MTKHRKRRGRKELKAINEALWETEDATREKESKQ